MDAPRFDIAGIGNAIVDVVAPAPESFLSKHDMRKGGMALIDAPSADAIYAAMPKGQESSGGSAANTCAVAAALGARVAYMGKVADDTLGATFRRDIGAAGVHFPTAPLPGGAATARCLILVTPDGQRTMNTFLGACVAFGETDLDEAVIAQAAVTLSGGLPVRPAGGAGRVPPRRRRGARGGAAGGAVAVGRVLRRPPPRRVPRAGPRRGHPVRQRDGDLQPLRDGRVRRGGRGGRADVALAALTRSEQGSLVLRGAERVVAQAEPATVVDTTGAGDAYAAGFLAGYTAGEGRPLRVRLGSIAAAEVIGHYGARPEADLKALAAFRVG